MLLYVSVCVGSGSSSNTNMWNPKGVFVWTWYQKMITCSGQFLLCLLVSVSQSSVLVHKRPCVQLYGVYTRRDLLDYVSVI